MARDLASRVGYRYIDSGAMYRAVALYALEHDMIGADGSVDEAALIGDLDKIRIDFELQADGTQHTTLNGVDVEREIRQLRVSSVVSSVATIVAVRHRLVALQQSMGESRGIVMDGRDIGTTVFPDAELKIFVDASPQTRAQRRFTELVEKGAQVSYADVLANVVHRDEVDRTRAESPLRKANDAIAIDNSHMTREEHSAWLLEQFNRVISRKK